MTDRICYIVTLRTQLLYLQPTVFLFVLVGHFFLTLLAVRPEVAEPAGGQQRMGANTPNFSDFTNRFQLLIFFFKMCAPNPKLLLPPQAGSAIWRTVWRY